MGDERREFKLARRHQVNGMLKQLGRRRWQKDLADALAAQAV